MYQHFIGTYWPSFVTLMMETVDYFEMLVLIVTTQSHILEEPNHNVLMFPWQLPQMAVCALALIHILVEISAKY
jgi:hypothetical protein